MKKKPQFYFGRCPNIIITVEMKCRNTFFRNSNSFSIIIIIINCPMLCVVVVVDINNKHLINKHTRCIFNLQHSGEIDGNVLQWVNLCWVVIVVEEFFLLNFFSTSWNSCKYFERWSMDFFSKHKIATKDIVDRC